MSFFFVKGKLGTKEVELQYLANKIVLKGFGHGKNDTLIIIIHFFNQNLSTTQMDLLP